MHPGSGQRTTLGFARASVELHARPPGELPAEGVEVADAVQVTSGLRDGETVVLDPPSALGPGTQVQVQNNAQNGARNSAQRGAKSGS